MKITVIIAALLALSIVFMAVKNNRTPKNLGLKEGQLAPMPSSPNAVSSQSGDPEKKVEPIPFRGSLQESHDLILKGLSQYGGIRVLRDEGNYIHAVHTTGTMKYKDDLEFYFDESAGLIHFRSASRIGYSDMGLNRQRYEDFLKLINGEM